MNCIYKQQLPYVYIISIPMNAPIVSMDNIKITEVTKLVGQQIRNPDSLVIESSKCLDKYIT